MSAYVYQIIATHLKFEIWLLQWEILVIVEKYWNVTFYSKRALNELVLQQKDEKINEAKISPRDTDHIWVKLMGLVAEPAWPTKAGPTRPAEAGAGYLSALPALVVKY